MNRITARLAVLLLVILGLSSCEKVIDITIPDQERKIVVNGLINPDEQFRVSLTRSLSVLESDHLVPIIGGTVCLYSGSELIGKLQGDSSGFYSLPAFNPQIGQSYRLTASAEDMAPIETSAIVPLKVQIISFDTTEVRYDWGEKDIHCTLKIHDAVGEHNFYNIRTDLSYKEYNYVTEQYTGRIITVPAYLNIDESDEFVDDESVYFDGQIFFEDLLFDGLDRTFKFDILNDYYFDSDSIWVDISVSQIEKSYFTYVKSYHAYQNSNGNPFAEPVQVYTNVNGGYGIFAGCSTTRFKFIIAESGKTP